MLCTSYAAQMMGGCMSGALGTRPPYCTVSLPSNNTWTKFKNLSRFWRDMNYIKGNPLKN